MAETFYLVPDKVRRARHQTFAHRSEIWGRVRVDLIKRTGLERQETRIAHPRHSLLLNLKGTAQRGEDFVDGRRVSFSARRPGSIVYLPAGSEWTGWDEGDAAASYLLVSIEQEFADHLLQGISAGRRTGLLPRIGFRDSTIELALQNIALELHHPDPLSGTMVESQAMELFVQMIRLNGADRDQAKGGLSSYDLKRAVALIEALPGQTPTLAELAKELGVSRFHFCRAFKQSMGMTPHTFIARRRLELSANMLRSTDRSATEIALECGFGNSSHFAIAFRRAYGASPIAFRRKCRM